MVFHPQKLEAVRCLVHTKEVMVTNYTNFTAKKKTAHTLNLNWKAKLALVINNRSFYLHLKAAAAAKKTNKKKLKERA